MLSQAGLRATMAGRERHLPKQAPAGQCPSESNMASSKARVFLSSSYSQPDDPHVCRLRFSTEQDRFKTRVSHGGARGEHCKEGGGDEPRRGLSTTSDAARRRLSPRPSRGCGGEGSSTASDLLDDPLRGRLRRSSLYPTPRRRNRGHGGFQTGPSLMRALVLLLTITALQDPDPRLESRLADLDELGRVISERHKNPFVKIGRDEWFKAIADVRSRLPAMKDAQVAVEFMKLGAMIGDGHTVVRPTGLGKYPVNLLWFKDGLHVVLATEGHRDLLKARVVAIGGTPVEEAARRVGVVGAADNESGARSQSAHWLTVPETLAGVGLIDDLNKAPFTVVDAQGKERVVELSPMTGKERRVLGFDKPDREMPIWRRAPRF